MGKNKNEVTWYAQVIILNGDGRCRVLILLWILETPNFRDVILVWFMLQKAIACKMYGSQSNYQITQSSINSVFRDLFGTCFYTYLNCAPWGTDTPAASHVTWTQLNAWGIHQSPEGHRGISDLVWKSTSRHFKNDYFAVTKQLLTLKNGKRGLLLHPSPMPWNFSWKLGGWEVHNRITQCYPGKRTLLNTID